MKFGRPMSSSAYSVARFSALLSAQDGYDDALAKLDAAIEQAEGVRDQVLEEIYRKIRPIERSYRQIHLFFENADPRDSVQRPPVEFYIFNADTAPGPASQQHTLVAPATVAWGEAPASLPPGAKVAVLSGDLLLDPGEPGGVGAVAPRQHLPPQAAEDARQGPQAPR